MKINRTFTKFVLTAALVLPVFLSSSVVQAHQQKQDTALEVVAGTLNADISVEKHRQADKAVANLIARQPGFISRETGIGKNGDWFVIVHWATLKDAENAGAVFMKSSEGQASMTMSDPKSILFKHYIVRN